MARADHNQPTILVVDDEMLLRELARTVLEIEGYRVLEATTGVEAIDILQRKSEGVHLVLLDLRMSGMSGEDTHAAIRKMSPSLPIILTSGHDLTGPIRALTQSEHSSFIRKPFRVSELVAEVQRVTPRSERGGLGETMDHNES